MKKRIQRKQNKVAKAYFYEEHEWLLNVFNNSNVVVFGKKGAGKDVLFALVIYLQNGAHYANMRYNGDTLLLHSLKQLCVGVNTFKALVDGNITKYKDPFIPNVPIFISDGAVYFGSQYDSEVTNSYPGLSIF